MPPNFRDFLRVPGGVGVLQACQELLGRHEEKLRVRDGSQALPYGGHNLSVIHNRPYRKTSAMIVSFPPKNRGSVGGTAEGASSQPAQSAGYRASGIAAGSRLAGVP